MCVKQYASQLTQAVERWRELFKDLKRRGLDGSALTLGIMDGLSGLERVFTEEFPDARVQRCQIHVGHNVLAKVPQNLTKIIADVCLKMEMNWRSKPIGKVSQNLPSLKRLAEDTFTQ